MKWSMGSGRASVAALPGTLALAALAYPLLIASGCTLSALGIHTFFSHICHQASERSFFLVGTPLAVCARCIGIYAGAAVGAFLRVERALAIKALWTTLALNIVEAATEYAGLHGNWLVVRALLGFALGAAVAALVAQAVREERRWRLNAAS